MNKIPLTKMKKLLYIIFVLFNLSCVTDKTDTVLGDSEWVAIKNILPAINSNDTRIYYQFENTQVKKIIYKLYLNCTYLGYEVNDSIAEYILNRNNKTINSTIDKIFKKNYIYDTIGFDNNALFFSEPFYVDENIICFSITSKKSGEINWQEVYFFKKQNNSFKIILFYDTKRDKFYKPIN